MKFADRAQAGQALAKALSAYRGQEAVVFAVPRGGVPVAAEVARGLSVPLDLIPVEKIGHPSDAGYAMAAVTDSGTVFAHPREMAGIDPDWFERKREARVREARRWRSQYLKERPRPPVEGRTAILVDDGLATGLTIMAAVKDLVQRRPARLVVAVPVAPQETMEQIRPFTDELIVAYVPMGWTGFVGSSYHSFPPVSDEEVMGLLETFGA